MAEVKILIEGYTNAEADQSDEGEEITCPTITLVRDGENIIIIDPGVLSSQEILIDKLKEAGLAVGDINLVFLTHSHLDHYRNTGMFASAKVLEYWGLWTGGKCDDRPQNLSEDIEIIETPGHSVDSLTMLVKTKEGTVAICGDVFWREDYPVEDPYATDQVKLAESRKKVLSRADYVITGHGKMFKVEKLSP